ncbi:hypothetical protein DRO59_02130 [Candidatus Bathyarchaeota archaeon]|nr:MAG: hypothetical protein DRO59_02130 [Candidatus Bathyarchaeota archaeon]
MGNKTSLMRPGQSEKVGRERRKRVLQYFTWREAAKQTLQIYEMVQHPQSQEEYKVVDLIEKLTHE